MNSLSEGTSTVPQLGSWNGVDGETIIEGNRLIWTLLPNNDETTLESVETAIARVHALANLLREKLDQQSIFVVSNFGGHQVR